MAFQTVYRIGAKGQADVLFKADKIDENYHSMRAMGLYLIDQDKITTPAPKQREVVSYIELDGEETGEFSMDGSQISREAFDYSLTFIMFRRSGFPINGAELSSNGVLKALMERIEAVQWLYLINTFTGFKCKCYFSKIEVEEDGRTQYDKKDFRQVKITFRVPKSNDCDFDLKDFKTTVEEIQNIDIEQTLYPLYDIAKHSDYTAGGGPTVTNTIN